VKLISPAAFFFSAIIDLLTIIGKFFGMARKQLLVPSCRNRFLFDRTRDDADKWRSGVC